MKRVVFGISLMLLLSACSRRVDGRLAEPLNITVSKSQAAVGEPVTVTLTGGFVNLAEARSPDYIIPNFRLGACFEKSIKLPGVDGRDSCLGKTLPLPPDIVMTDGQSYQKTFGKQVVKSGEAVTLKHSFSFTSTDPGLVKLTALSQILSEEFGWLYTFTNIEVEVQFE